MFWNLELDMSFQNEFDSKFSGIDHFSGLAYCIQQGKDAEGHIRRNQMRTIMMIRFNSEDQT